jgi:hypothetical protein
VSREVVGFCGGGGRGTVEKGGNIHGTEDRGGKFETKKQTSFIADHCEKTGEK